MKKFFVFLLLLPNIVLAQTGSTMDNLNQAVAGSYNTDRKLVPIVAEIINIFLALLGMLFVVLIVVAGFKWMTAMGDAKKVEDARNMISNAVVGLVIVLAAYSISKFVVKEIFKATTVNVTN